MFGEAGVAAHVQVLDKQLVVSLKQPAPGSALEFAKMLANGNWPVTIREGKKGFDLAHNSGGTTEFKEYPDQKSVVIKLACPGWSVQKVFLHLSQMIKTGRYKLNYGYWSLVPADGEIKDWRQLNQMIKGITRSGVLSNEVSLNQIEWRLANYQGFAAMAVMHKEIGSDEEDGEILTRLFEFELEGQRGFMEIAYEEGGFCAFFSFDTKEPFTALSKITGQKLKEWS
jgi:hypothetical protein